MRGATVPTGETEFQFKAANLRFQSSTYEWLVVSGARAQFRGSGSIVIHQPPAANGRGTQSGAAQPVPTVFAVHAPSPNPTRGGALLGVDLPEAADVSASVIDVSGREVERLACGVLAAGRHELRLAAVDRSGRAVPAGMYFVRVTSVRGAGPRQTAVRKLIVQ